MNFGMDVMGPVGVKPLDDQETPRHRIRDYCSSPARFDTVELEQLRVEQMTGGSPGKINQIEE